LKYSVLIILVFIIVYSCKNGNTKEVQNNSFRYYDTGRFLIKESYDGSGRITTKQYYNKDTIPDGAEFDYYNNGKMKKWKWFDAKQKTPYCGAYYDSNGVFDTFKGDAILNVGNEDSSSLYVTLANPPNVKFIVTFDDSYKNKHINELIYDPIKTDSTSFIIIHRSKDEFVYNKEHKYTLNFYIVDSNYKVLSGAKTAVQLNEKSYTYINTAKSPQQLLVESK